jgi:hypothetical protein
LARHLFLSFFGLASRSIQSSISTRRNRQVPPTFKPVSGFHVDPEIVGDFINGHDVSCHAKHFPKIILFEISMEICGFLQGGNSKQFQSSDEIGLALGVSLLVLGFFSLCSMSGHLSRGAAQAL